MRRGTRWGMIDEWRDSDKGGAYCGESNVRKLQTLSVSVVGLLMSLPAMASDVSSGPGNAKVITVGAASASAVFEYPRDADWYKVFLNGGDFYAAYLNVGGNGHLNLRNKQGKVLATETGGPDYDTGISFYVPRSAWYYLEYVEDDPGDYGYPGHYSYRVSHDCDTGQYTLCNINTGSSQQRTIAYSWDEDWIRARLQTGVTYTATTTEMEDIDFTLRDVNNNVLAHYEFISGLPVSEKRITFTPNVTDDYYLVVNGQADNGGQYVLSLSGSNGNNVRDVRPHRKGKGGGR